MRVDPIFGLETPLLFAHRGGAAEVPESTEEAFRHAAKCGTDVLELDVQLTRDGEIVVWHGPELDKVHNGSRRFSKSDKIWDFDWRDLDGVTWVVHPEHQDVVTCQPERTLLTLEKFVDLVGRLEDELRQQGKPRILHLNIELKKTKEPAPSWDGQNADGMSIWDTLFRWLDREAPQRKIVVASASPEVLEKFRAENAHRGGFRYPTNLSWKEQLAYRKLMAKSVVTMAAGLAPLVLNIPPQRTSLQDIAFETSHALVSKELVSEVQQRGGSIYVFLTGFSFVMKEVDGLEVAKLKPELGRLLATGIDGIMTDYPEKVADILGK